MATGRYFQALTSFDLLGNFLPGAFSLAVFVALLPSQPFPTTTGGVLFFTLLSYGLGHFIQFHASKSQWDCFETTLVSVQKRPILVDQQGLDPEDDLIDSGLGFFSRAAIRASRTSAGDLSEKIKKLGDTVSNYARKLPFWYVIVSFFSPVSCWFRNPVGEPINNTGIASQVHKDLITRYNIDRGTEDYDLLINIISSEIDDVSTPARSIRFQAIRNFHRAMWLASWYGFVLVSLLYLFNTSPDTQRILEFIEVTYQVPPLFDQWGADWHIVLIFGFITVGFERLSAKFELQFTEYLFSDYLVSRQRNRDEDGWRENIPKDTGSANP